MLDLEHLTKEEVVKYFGSNRIGGFTMAVLESDISKGAPVNEDGTINMWNYSAWVQLEGYNAN